MVSPYARPTTNRFGDAELKRSYGRKSVLWLLVTAAAIVGPMLASNVVPRESRDLFLFVLLAAPVAWFVGLGYYAKSKGYTAVLGLLGFFNVLGLLVLLMLPDLWRQALEHEARIARYDAPPSNVHPAGEAASGAYPAWWNG